MHPRMSIKGGGERVAIHSVTAALKGGHEVTLVSEDFDVANFEDFFDCQGLFTDIERLRYPAFRPLIRRGLMIYQRLAYHQSQLRRILSNGQNFDLVLSTQDIGYVPTAKVPVVQYCYFPEYFAHLGPGSGLPLWGLYYWPASIFYRNRVSRVDRFLTVSDFTRDFVRKKWGRESLTFYPPCPVKLYDVEGEVKENLVITVGRVVQEKRMDLFLGLARMLPSYKFLVVGSIPGNKSSYLDWLKKQSPANVEFVMSPLRKVRDRVAKAKVYVHCAENEHFGITIVEGMAMGCVPVVHDSGGPREIVTEDVGFRWGTVSEAAGLVSRIIEDEALRVRLSISARAKSKVYSPEIFESKVGTLLEQYR